MAYLEYFVFNLAKTHYNVWNEALAVLTWTLLGALFVLIAGFNSASQLSANPIGLCLSLGALVGSLIPMLFLPPSQPKRILPRMLWSLLCALTLFVA